ncbi:MAG TPA: phosphoribosylglycinamide formyltransferase [Steroidobacteraceae bacterium]|nr:phosphoribosylglycinamide formyltransferase [Steroidobacteraceae bacterium]
MNIAVLASHEGTTLQAVLDACAAGTIGGRVALVISNNADSGALRRARTAGVDTLHLSSRTHPDPRELDRAICTALEDHHAGVVLLAGYMKKLGPRTLERFAGRVINTHPGLLPRFGGQGMYGARVHEAVLASGERASGASIHWVDDAYDTGPVLARVTVPVEAADTVETLGARVQRAERSLLVQVLAEFASGKRELPAAHGAPPRAP